MLGLILLSCLVLLAADEELLRGYGVSSSGPVNAHQAIVGEGFDVLFHPGLYGFPDILLLQSDEVRRELIEGDEARHIQALTLALDSIVSNLKCISHEIKSLNVDWLLPSDFPKLIPYDKLCQANSFLVLLLKLSLGSVGGVNIDLLLKDGYAYLEDVSGFLSFF